MWETYQIPRDRNTLLDHGGAAWVPDPVIDLRRDPCEGLASRGREVVAQAEEVREEEGSEKAASRKEEGERVPVFRRED